MSVEQVEHTVEGIHERAEVEQFAHHRQIVVALQLLYLSLARRVLNGVRGVFVHSLITYDSRLWQRRTEHHAFECAATRERHVCLSVGEGALHVDDGVVERKTLTLVNGDSPSRLHGELREGSFHLLAYLVGLLVEHVARVVPLFGLNTYIFAGVLRRNGETLGVYRRNGANHTIVVSLVGRRVVLHEHHLRTGLQRERLVGREEHLWILAFDGGSVGIGLAGEQFELVVVDALRLPVVRRKTYVAVFFERLEVGYIARVERRKHRSVSTVFAHLIQYVEETLVALAIHLRQFDNGVACALQGERREEVRRGVIAREHLPFVVLSHGSKLTQVADHNHLNTAKRKVVLTETAQHAVYGIKKVGTHHRDLVDDERVDRTDDVYLLFREAELLLLEIIVGYERRKRQLEERVDGHTFGIDGSDARRRYHHDALRRLLLQSTQKGGLSRASLTGEEEVGVRCLYYVPSELRLLCHFLC